MARPRFAVLLAASLWIISAAVVLVWLLHVDVPGWRQGVAGAALLASGSWALWSLSRSPSGQARWDGAAWDMPWGRTTAGLDVTLDLQQVLLVRVADGRWPSRWLWLERHRCPHRWLELRRAVYSRPTPPAPAPARPAVATP